MRVVVISDVHLGTDVSRAQNLLDILDRIEFDIIVINGDLVQDENWNRLKKNAWKFLGKCRKWTSQKNKREVIWCEGNHDRGVFHVIGNMLGLSLIGEDKHLKLKVGEKTYVFMHGHQFDNWMPKNKFFCEFWGSIYDWFQFILGEKNRHIARNIKLKSKSVLGVCKGVKKAAATFAKFQKADVICCGHVHHAEDTLCENGVWYVNTGSITEVPSHYLIIDEDGYKLYEF
jgi:predicted phosphodiesterase